MLVGEFVLIDKGSKVGMLELLPQKVYPFTLNEKNMVIDFTFGSKILSSELSAVEARNENSRLLFVKSVHDKL